MVDNILNDQNIELYKVIAKKVFGESSYFNILKVYNIISKFAEVLPEEILYKKFRFPDITINTEVKIVMKKRQKIDSELLHSYENKNYDLMTMDIELQLSDEYKKCIKNAKFVKEHVVSLQGILEQVCYYDAGEGNWYINSSAQVNCSDTSISNQDKAVCTSEDMFKPLWIGLVLGLAGLVIGGIAIR